jgi:hypothetical protein
MFALDFLAVTGAAGKDGHDGKAGPAGKDGKDVCAPPMPESLLKRAP